MNIILFLFGTGFVSVLCDEYNTEFDNIDIDAIIYNDRLLKNYIDCLLDRGRCTSEGTELKKHVQDALDTGCSKCSEKQRGGVRKAIKYIAENRKEWFKELLDKYDPNGSYREKYRDLIEKENVAL